MEKLQIIAVSFRLRYGYYYILFQLYFLIRFPFHQLNIQYRGIIFSHFYAFCYAKRFLYLFCDCAKHLCNLLITGSCFFH